MAKEAAESDSVAPAAETQAASPYDALGVDDTKTKELTASLAANQREKIATTDKIYSDMEMVTDRTMPRLEMLSRTSGVEAEKMKPWNADEEAAKRRTDPIEAFGSIGSVFGILASAFTHAPMENALNASAAAINSIKEGDSKAYDRAYKAWEDNTKQALDRHRIQHEAYQDAVSLLSTNMAVANTKQQVAAARFGDKQVLAMLDAGMSKEVQELLASRQKMSLELAENLPRIALENAKMDDLMKDPRFKLPPDDPKRNEMIREWQRRWNPQVGESALRFEEIQRHNRELEDIARTRQGDVSARQAEIERHNKATEELRKTGAGNTSLTGDRQRAQDIVKYREELAAEKKEDGTPKYTSQQIADMAAKRESQLKTTAAAPSGNRVDDLKSLRDRAVMMGDAIDKMDALMAKHNFITGLGGKIGRTAEAISNITGISNESDRAQFARYVNELQEWGTRVLNESKGRPLSTEVTKLQSVLPGLAMGDTIANTIRAYREVRPLIARIQTQLDKRISGDWEPLAPEKTNPSDSLTPWERDKQLMKKNKRSDIGGESDVA